MYELKFREKIHLLKLLENNLTNELRTRFDIETMIRALNERYQYIGEFDTSKSFEEEVLDYLEGPSDDSPFIWRL